MILRLGLDAENPVTPCVPSIVATRHFVVELPPDPVGLPSLPYVMAKFVSLGFSLELSVVLESFGIQLSRIDCFLHCSTWSRT